MRNLLSSLFFILIFVALGAMAFAAAPRGQEAAQPAAAPGELTNIQSDEPLAPSATSANNYNDIAMALDATSTITDAQAIANEITGTQQVLRWNKATQSFQFWIPEQVFPPNGLGTNFSTALGEPYLVQVDSTAPATFTVVGDVPPQTGQAGALQFDLVGGSPCEWTYISVPLDHDSITDAQGLAESIRVNASDVEQMLVWNTATQSYTFYIPDPVFSGGLGTNFNVNIGYPYFICSANNITWP